MISESVASALALDNGTEALKVILGFHVQNFSHQPFEICRSTPLLSAIL